MNNTDKKYWELGRGHGAGVKTFLVTAQAHQLLTQTARMRRLARGYGAGPRGMNGIQCPETRPFKPAPDHNHECRKELGHKGRCRCGCLGGKCRVSWRRR